MLYLHAHAHGPGYTESTERCDGQPLRILGNDVKCNVTSLRKKLELVKLKIPFSVDTKRNLCFNVTSNSVCLLPLISLNC